MENQMNEPLLSSETPSQGATTHTAFNIEEPNASANRISEETKGKS